MRIHRKEIIIYFADDGTPFETEEKCREYEKNQLHYYDVTVDYLASYYVRVCARSEEEAKRKAIGEASSTPAEELNFSDEPIEVSVKKI